MTIDRFLACCQIFWPPVLFFGRRAYLAVKRIEAKFDTLDELHNSEIVQWRLLAALQHDVTVLKENA
jgi:hypothetical protein